MTRLISYLGPAGTYAESAAIACSNWLLETTDQESALCPYPSIAQTLRAASEQRTDFAVVPVENLIEGSVSMTLDTLWQLGNLQIQKAVILPISHALISQASVVQQIQTVYSHPQALAQCQEWLEKWIPEVKLIPTNSTAEALQHVDPHGSVGVIASRRAAQLYQYPILAHPINDRPDNCTRFWLLSLIPSLTGSHTSIAFSFPANLSGALAKALEIFARRDINLSRIESRPTKRSLGDYLFFIDFEADIQDESVQSALAELADCTETLKIFGSYTATFID